MISHNWAPVSLTTELNIPQKLPAAKITQKSAATRQYKNVEMTWQEVCEM